MFVLMPDGYEVLGAGLATCLSNCVAFLFFVVVLVRMGRGSVITFSLKGGMPKGESIGAIFGVGVPSAITTFLFDMDYVILDKLMVGHGDLAMAAVGIVLKVERFPLNVGVGICQGMMPLVAYNYAAKNKRRMEDTIHMAGRPGLDHCRDQHRAIRAVCHPVCPPVHPGNPNGGPGFSVPSHPGASYPLDVPMLLHRIHFPSLW